MALKYVGRLTREGTVHTAINTALKYLNLKACKKITVKFDPFTEDSHNVRYFNNVLFRPEIIDQNLACKIKTEVLCDRSEPSVTFEVVNGEKFNFKCANLTTLEIIQLYNKHITPLAPKVDSTPPPATKSEKKKSKK